MDAQGEIPDHRLVAKAFGHAFGVDHLGAGAAAFQRLHLHRAQAFQLFAPVLAQGIEPGEPALIALAPGAAAMGAASPAHWRSCGRACGARVLPLPAGASRQVLESGKALIQPAGPAAVQPDHRAGQVLQEAPVMADQDQRPAHGFEFAFQPFDGGQIQMIGGLVQQKNVRPGRQHPRQRRAPRFAARQGVRVSPRRSGPDGPEDKRRDWDHRPAASPPRHSRGWWHNRRDWAPAADSGWWRRAGRSARRSSASIMPAAIFSKVDLPEPLRPTRHSRSPSPTLNSAPSSSWVLPKRIWMSLRNSSGAMPGLSYALIPRSSQKSQASVMSVRISCRLLISL